MANHYKFVGILLALVLIIIGITFYLSSQSSEDSIRLSNQTLAFYEAFDAQTSLSDAKPIRIFSDFFSKYILGGRYESPQAKIRKIAHFLLYFSLGVATSVAALKMTKNNPFRGVLSFLLGISLPALIAVLDESLQALSNRTSLLSDVFLDTLGGITGALLVLIMYGIKATIHHFRKI